MQDMLVAGGVRFGVVQLKQDWEHLCSQYGFKNWCAIEFCPFCDARKDATTWVEGGINSQWRSTVWDQSKLLEALGGTLQLPDGRLSSKLKWLSHVWRIPYMSILYIKCDPMHVLFTDGVFNRIMACLLYQLTIRRRDVPGRTKEQRITTMWEEFEHQSACGFQQRVPPKPTRPKFPPCRASKMLYRGGP